LLQLCIGALDNNFPKYQQVSSNLVEKTAYPLKIIFGLIFFDEQYTEQFWYNPADSRAYRRIRWRKGSDPWVKTYCWSNKGVRRQNIRPGNSDENKQPPIKWTWRTESFYPYPKDIAECSMVSGPAPRLGNWFLNLVT
jgi:hypothetical protein